MSYLTFVSARVLQGDARDAQDPVDGFPGVYDQHPLVAGEERVAIRQNVEVLHAHERDLAEKRSPQGLVFYGLWTLQVASIINSSELVIVTTIETYTFWQVIKSHVFLSTRAHKPLLQRSLLDEGESLQLQHRMLL